MYPEARMGKRELSLPVMALGAVAVFAVAATVLYVGVSAHREPPAASLPPVADDSDAASHPDTKADPRDAQEWLALAAARRRNRDYAGARDAYLQVIQRNAMTADS